MKIFLEIVLCCILFSSQGAPRPIQFALSNRKIVDTIPHKIRDFAFIIPSDTRTYIYHSEQDYYAGYQQAYFALTWAKGGWDCMRHYEILANGCIPYFIDLDLCHPNTMSFLPKELILEAMHLPGVPQLTKDSARDHNGLKIDHTRFDRERYFAILKQLLAYTRQYLTTSAMAQYFLNEMHYTGTGTILFLSNDPSPDYLCDSLLIGLKEILGARVIDFPQRHYVYTSYLGNTYHLYGRGISYTKLIEDSRLDRHNLEQRIKNREFDLIIYGSVHRGLRFYDCVSQCYPPEQIAYLCGEDAHTCEYASWPNLFLREFDSLPQ